MNIKKMMSFSRSYVTTIVFCLLVLFFHTEELSAKKKTFPLDVHVVLIGLDGWGAYSLADADMPFLEKMMQKGSWTLKKRSVLPSSSAANWASMFMGASPEIHGYTQWNSKTPEIPSMVLGEHKIFPTISQILRVQRKDAEIGLFFHWEGIKYVEDTLSINHIGWYPKGNRKDWQTEITTSVCNYVKDKKPTFCTIVYDFPDHYGHAKGFESEDYYHSLSILDKSIETICQSYKDAGIIDKTIFIVTSDHGGREKTHGGKTLEEMESPLIIFGKNVKENNEIRESVLQYDIAATIAYIFGLNTPQAWIGRPIVSAFNVKNR